ncbi:MAG: hypothetical protein RL110_1148 [Bacteroidota bacterium]
MNKKIVGDFHSNAINMKQIQDNIDLYIASFTGMNNHFQSLINGEKERLSTVVNTHTSELKSQEEQWIITQKDLTFKLEKLNDEIVRYGSLLKKEFKLTELSGVLKERFHGVRSNPIAHRLPLSTYANGTKDRCFWTNQANGHYTAYAFRVSVDKHEIQCRQIDKNAGYFVRLLKTK